MLPLDVIFSAYRITFFLSFVAGFAIAMFHMKRHKVSTSFILLSMLANLFAAIYGAKYFDVVMSGFRVSFVEAGLSAIGAAGGIICVTMLLSYIFQDFSRPVLEGYILALPLMYSIAKIGCYLTGCCHGVAYDGPFSVTYVDAILDELNGGPYFPVQLLESVVFLLLFAIGVLLARKDSSKLIWFLLFACAGARFLVEFLRGKEGFALLSNTQVLCILFIVVLAVVWGVKSRKLRDKR